MFVEYASITPVVMALVELVSRVDGSVVPRSILPLVSVVFGITIGFFIGVINGDIVTGSLTGLASGLSASGLYDVVTKTTK